MTLGVIRSAEESENLNLHVLGKWVADYERGTPVMQSWSVVWSGESRADSCASAEGPHVNILGPWYSNVDPSRGVQERVGGGGILSRRELSREREFPPRR